MHKNISKRVVQALITSAALCFGPTSLASAQTDEEPVTVIRQIPAEMRDGRVITPAYREQLTVFPDGRRESVRLPAEAQRQPTAAPRAGLGLSAPAARGLSNRGLTVPGGGGFTTGPREQTRAVIGSDAVWLEPVIPVCWEDINVAADGRAWTQDAVEKSWASVANLTFTGWGACTPDSKGIRIKVTEAGPRVEKLGRGINGMKDGMVLNFAFAAWGTGCAANREYCIRALAVHEFGHAIGLAHEHNREDRALCRAETQGPMPAYMMTAYDPTSVMNYCAKDWINRGELSALDVTGVRMIYGPFTDETPAVARYYATAAFKRADGTEARPAPVEIDFKLTNASPVETRTIWLCSDGDRLLKLDATGTLSPAQPQITVETKAELYRANGCADRGNLFATTDMEHQLNEPLPSGIALPRDLPAADASMGETRLIVAPYRKVGPEYLGGETCTDCAAAAQEAVFANAPEPDFQITPLRQIQPINAEPENLWIETPLAFSAIQSTAVWLDPTIPVCWDSMRPEDETGRYWTRRAVENTWEKVSDVDFTGWGLCANDARGIRIEVTDGAPHVDSLGRGIDGQPGGMTLNFSFETWGTGCASALQYCISTLAVHEFGHALGLAHEHNRGDRTACEKEPQGPVPDFVLTAYDDSSVMNYCSAQWINDGRLSELDVLGIRQVYGPYTEDAPFQIEFAASASFYPVGEEVWNSENAVEFETTETFFLSEDAPIQTFSYEFCDGDSLLLQASGTAELNAEAQGDVETRIVIYETQNCQPGGAIIRDSTSSRRVDAFGQNVVSAGNTIMERIGENGEELGRTIRYNFKPKRIAGSRTGEAGCESCAAAAEDARFAGGAPPIEFTGASLYQSGLVVTGIASPWPDDFNLNLNVCEDAAREIRYGNRGWSEENIDRLCDASPTSAEPAKCFGIIMEGNTRWGAGSVWNPDNARNLCAGSRDGEGTVRCFSRQISNGIGWPQAIEACDAD